MDYISIFVFDFALWVVLGLVFFSIGYFGGAFFFQWYDDRKYHFAQNDSDQSDGSHAHEGRI